MEKLLGPLIDLLDGRNDIPSRGMAGDGELARSVACASARAAVLPHRQGRRVNFLFGGLNFI